MAVEMRLLQHINGIQGPFCDPGTVWRQRHKPLNPTLRVATSYNSEDIARYKCTCIYDCTVNCKGLAQESIKQVSHSLLSHSGGFRNFILSVHVSLIGLVSCDGS